MARVGVSIEKATSFRGVSQPFSNTYYYDTPLPVTVAVANSLIDHIVSLEKPMHTSNVDFKFARCWTAGGTKAENEMITQKALSGVGTNASIVNNFMDKERAFLVRFRAGNDSRGRPVYLRKWWHLYLDTFGGASVTNTMLANTAGIAAGHATQLETWGNQFKSITALPQNFDLVSDKGRQISGATKAHPYLEHHQLGDQWR